MAVIGPNGSRTARSSGTVSTTGCSSFSLPRSRSCITAMPVNVFVQLAQWKIVSRSTRRFCARSA